MKTVVICCSMRHKIALEKFITELIEKGISEDAIFEPDFSGVKERTTQKHEQDRLRDARYRAKVPGLVHRHLARISAADIVFIFNKEGYIGHNTLGEIFYASGKEKPIYTLEEDVVVHDESEICVDVLIHGVVPSAERLAKLLQ